MKDLPDNIATYVCPHVFSDNSKVAVVAMDDDGSLSAGCGCAFDEARVIGFGHLKPVLTPILDRQMLTKISYYEKGANGEWKFGYG